NVIRGNPCFSPWPEAAVASFRKRRGPAQSKQNVCFGVKRQHEFGRNRLLRPAGDTRAKHVANGRRPAAAAVVVMQRPWSRWHDYQKSAFSMVLDQSASHVICHFCAAAEMLGAKMHQKGRVACVEFSAVYKVG